MNGIVVRRSNLFVSLNDAEAVRAAWRHDADAVTLDLDDVPAMSSGGLRSLVSDAIDLAGRGGAEVFVHIGMQRVDALLAAAVARGLRGLVLSNIESASEVERAAEIAAVAEREHGLGEGALLFILRLGSARAVWDMRAIVRASARVSQVGLDEASLAHALGIEPHPDYDPFVYARGRLAVEATAASVGAVGMAYPLSVAPRELPYEELHAFATKARNLGMKGVICPHPSWVAPVNAAFTPTAELVAWNRRVREAFAAGVAAGTAAVPLDGKMIDVPVDEWAKVVLAMAQACAARDREKQSAVSRSGTSHSV